MLINTHSYYSLRYGTLNLESLLSLTSESGHEAVALTDINTTSACIDFLRESKKYIIKPVVGADIREGIVQKFVVLAKNNNGFHALNDFITEYLIEGDRQNLSTNRLEDCFIIYPFDKSCDYSNLKSNEYIGVHASDLTYIEINKVDQSKMVVLQTATFYNNRSYNIHKLLRAIDENTVLSKLKDNDFANKNQLFLTQAEVLKQFENQPKIIENTKAILNDCHVSFDIAPNVSNQNLKTYGESQEKDFEQLRKLSYDGIHARYKSVDDVLLDRIDTELAMIKQKGFVSYFLINWDIVMYAKQKGYFHVGRGSGANSLVAYLLEITDVDPLELDLYFERFINLHRSSPPDFDIDFSWKDREDVTAYIFKRYKNVALVGTRNTFQRKAIERELGKVFGLSEAEIDMVHQTKSSMAKSVLDQTAQLVKKYSEYIIDFPSYLSVHAGGIVISDQPITCFTSTFLPPKGYPTLQFDMHTAEDIGLHKFDILSQRGLGKIKDAIAIIQDNKNEFVFEKVHDIVALKQDENINALIREADAIGCFYVESPAMRMLLKKLRVDDYLGLVAASSIIRPGVAKSGMMRAYIERYRCPEKREDALPIMLDIMPDTYGIMVYQEDVLKVAHTFGGLDLGEADVLRRGMAGKFRKRETFQIVKDRFFNNAIAKGYAPESVAEVWRQIASFAGYAFAKGHSASYAVESYQALFLKAYYPLEYMVATINNGGGFYRSEVYFIEIKKKGGRVHAPCVNTSENKTVIFGVDVYMGFGFIHSFESKSAYRIMEARILDGPFLSLDDFINRVNISLEQIILLIKIDAFRFTGINKRSLLWEIHLKKAKVPAYQGKDLFRIKTKKYTLPTLMNSWKADAFDQMELLGFSLYSFFDLLENPNTDELLAKDLSQYLNEIVWLKGYLVTLKKTRTVSGQTMFFGTFFDKTFGWIDTVHFPNIVQKYPVRGSGVYAIKGKVTMDFDCTAVDVIVLKKLPVIEDPRYADIKENKNVVTNVPRKSIRKVS